MPPKAKKAGATEPNKKTDQKKKEKIIEDKTFGMKNKKGTKQQKFIKMVNTQVQHGGKSARQVQLEQEGKHANKKDEKKKEMEQLNMLFRPVEQKVSKGVDPKSMLCAFFKQGQCKKGDRCKFSHDLNIGRKGEKRSVYDDASAGDKDTMEDWDEAKLEEVVNKKHGENNKSLPQTSIICKYFLDALENSKYGWFWACPNGTMCHYRHALPPGFMLKKDKKKEDIGEKISLEELVEKERAALSSKNLTKVTLESFVKWKERKRREKQEKATAVNEKKKSDFKAGKVLGISGREMFEFNPELIAGDDDEAEDIVYEREVNGEEDEDEEVKFREINLDALAAEARENDGTGTKANPDTRFSGATSGDGDQAKPADRHDEGNKLDMAAALPPDERSDGNAELVNGDVIATDTPIDENLFDGEDLDFVEDELDNLDLDD